MPVETHHPLRVRTIGTRGLKAGNNGTRTMESVACIIPLIEQISLNNHMYAHQTRGQLQVDVCIYEALARRQVVRISDPFKSYSFRISSSFQCFSLRPCAPRYSSACSVVGAVNVAIEQVLLTSSALFMNSQADSYWMCS